MLVGDGRPAEDPDVVDLTDGPPGLARIEMRLQRVEHGVRAIADEMRESHGQLREAIRTMEAELRERDRVTRSEIQRMLWQALGPVAASIERLSQSLRRLPPAIVDGDALSSEPGDPGDWSITAEPPAPADVGQPHPTEELKDLPARPFELED